jgi:hypothetical protein
LLAFPACPHYQSTALYHAGRFRLAFAYEDPVSFHNSSFSSVISFPFPLRRNSANQVYQTTCPLFLHFFLPLKPLYCVIAAIFCDQKQEEERECSGMMQWRLTYPNPIVRGASHQLSAERNDPIGLLIPQSYYQWLINCFGICLSFRFWYMPFCCWRVLSI